jgi:hypothetical protein
MTTCKHADSGCNYPEGECLGVCMGCTKQQERIDAVAPQLVATLKNILFGNAESIATRSASHD